MQRSADSALNSNFTPFASRMSAAPTLPDAALLPCLATFAPAAATVSAAAVETLNVCSPSPPVPTTSTSWPSVGTRIAFSRIARAIPATTSGVSPVRRSATRNPPICAGVASPVIMSPAAAAASSSESGRRSASRRIAS